MQASALVLCHDASSLKLLSSVLEDLEIQATVSRSHHQAMELLLEGEFVALIADFDAPGAADLLKMARLLVPRRRPALFAIVGKNDSGGQAAQAGANCTLYKPLRVDDVRTSLAAGKKLMRADLRRAPRHAMRALVCLELETGTLPAIGIDVSTLGLAIQATEPVPQMRTLSVRFALPDTHHVIHAVADVMWADEKGRAGMFFTRMSTPCRKHLKNWLSKRGFGAKDAVRVLLSPADACFTPTTSE